MRVKLTIYCCLIGLAVNAQNSKVSLSTFFTPSYAYRYTNTVDNSGEKQKTYRDSIDKHMFGFQAGQLVHFQVNKYLSINSGICFSDMGHLQRHRYLIKSALGDTLANKKLDLFYHRTYLDIPLTFEIKLRQDRLSYFTTTGIEANFLLNKYELALLDDEPQAIKVVNNAAINKINLSVRIGFGASYLLTPTTSFYMAATAKTQLKPIITDELKEYNYLAGITLGIRYRLK